MTHPTQALLERLESLLEKATTGPYRAHDHMGMARVGENPDDWIGYGWVGRLTKDSTPDGRWDAKWLNTDRRKDGLKEYRERASADVHFVAEALNALPTLISEIRRLEAEVSNLQKAQFAWRGIGDAPKDGSYILAVLGPNDSKQIGHLAGRAFSIRHEGQTPSGYDMGWSLFPGFGGVPDHWFAGWLPLPDTSSIKGVAGQ